MRTTTVFLSAALTAVAIAAPHEGHDHTEDSVAAAQDSVKMFLPMADAQELLAYEIEVGAEATTYAVGCPSDASSDECGFPSGFLYTGGPKTVAYTMASPEYG